MEKEITGVPRELHGNIPDVSCPRERSLLYPVVIILSGGIKLFDIVSQ